MSDVESSDGTNVIDRSVKVLFRECPMAIMRLAGIAVAPEKLRIEDANLNLPELRADHLFVIVGEGGTSEAAIYLEYQLEPDAGLLVSWCAKWGGLLRQLKMPVVLLALYLQRGDRATFPDRLQVQAGGLAMNLSFPVVRLWEHAERIRSGELPELAPLLVLCDDKPTEATVREEVALIHASRLPAATQAELLGLALLVATRRFTRDLLLPIFEEDWSMIEGLEILDDLYRATGKLDRWKAEAEAIGRAKGEAEGRAEGRAEGESRGIRETILRIGSQRFGEPSPEAMMSLEAITAAERLQQLAVRLLQVESWQELLAGE
ncbi:MAG TPA: hypothetical protein VKT77_16295 [Chthonomonadaceae bacterium]|nr:hypothetical protein [Chthonomonadaceae bacterium]